jgi:hypothetical protein
LQSLEVAVESCFGTLGRFIIAPRLWALRSGMIHAAFPSRRGLLPSVRALLDFLADEYARLSAFERQQILP